MKCKNITHDLCKKEKEEAQKLFILLNSQTWTSRGKPTTASKTPARRCSCTGSTWSWAVEVGTTRWGRSWRASTKKVASWTGKYPTPTPEMVKVAQKVRPPAEADVGRCVSESSLWTRCCRWIEITVAPSAGAAVFPSVMGLWSSIVSTPTSATFTGRGIFYIFAFIRDLSVLIMSQFVCFHFGFFFFFFFSEEIFVFFYLFRAFCKKKKTKEREREIKEKSMCFLMHVNK